MSSDIGELYAAKRERSRVRRASHREASPKMLEDAGIVFESKNFGAHIIVYCGDQIIDFWPGTGKWIGRKSGKGRGVRKLIRFCQYCGKPVREA